jgi:putative transposase
MRTNQPGHLKAFDYLGLYRYFLTFCTDYRRPVFLNARVVELTLSQISTAARQQRFALLAYCFMPDHLHLLVEALSDGSDCRSFIKIAKQLSGYYFSREFSHKLWQRYGFERVLRDDEATLVVAKYILRNPVRAGLVCDVREYPFVGFEQFSVEQIMDGISDVPSTE